MTAFIPAYFEALSSFLADHVNPDEMLSALLSGTRYMISNSNPSFTLQQAFDTVFFSQIGKSREKLQPEINRFYDGVFPTLRHLTQPREEAVNFIEWAFAQGHNVAIATNPLFPRTAIYQRLNWAGLPPENYPFTVISSFETFHFTKPSPAYFAEMLGRMGCPDGEVLMVGDDVKNDLAGSCSLGLSAFWISSPDAVLPDGIELVGRGTLDDLRSWLERSDRSTLEPDFSTPESLMALMLATPATISGLLASFKNEAQISAATLRRRPIAKEWSLIEIICHLRDTESEVNLPRLNQVLEEDNPFIPARSTTSWASERDYRHQDFAQALQDFVIARMQTLDILRKLQLRDWQRKARHAIFGPTSLFEQMRFTTEHDRLHIRQMWAVLQQILI